MGVVKGKLEIYDLREELTFEHTKMVSNFHPEMLTREAQGGKSTRVYKKKEERRDFSQHCHKWLKLGLFEKLFISLFLKFPYFLQQSCHSFYK